MRISVVGTGYVGLVSGACLADVGHTVICVDLDPRKVEAINAGKPTIHEQGLPELLSRTVGRSLSATVDLERAVLDSDITLIAVGTPAKDGRIDLAHVRQAAIEIGRAMARKASYHVVVVKSTVIPGTTDGIVRQALEEASGLRAGPDFGLAMNPEFLTEGTAIADFAHPDRIVIGGIDERTQTLLGEAYASFESVPRFITNNTTAEFIKYASNAALATMISFANELSRLCSAVGGADITDVMRGVHASAYFTTRKPGAEPVPAAITSFLEAGCGFGGSCLPKDVTALVGQGQDMGLQMPLLSSVLGVNRTQPSEMIDRLLTHYPDPRGLRAAVLGIAFKPDTDDIRESPAFPIIRRLLSLGVRVTAYDPVARPEGDFALSNVQLAESLQAAVDDADVIMLVTRWSEFESLPELIAKRTREPLVIDGRRVLKPSDYSRYEGIGLAVTPHNRTAS